MEKSRLRLGTAAAEAAAIVCATYARGDLLGSPVLVPLGIGVDRINRMLALQDLHRVGMLDFYVEGETAVARLRARWRDFLDQDLSRGLATAARLRRCAAALNDTEARRLIDDLLQRYDATASQTLAMPGAPMPPGRERRA